MRGEDAYGNQSYYYYEKNLQGDVIAVLDSNGSVVASYVYDAWGRVLETEYAEIDWESASYNQVFFERLNPFLYRGYYYDSETGFYYLQTRYYDPAIGRFVNADTLVSTGQGLLGCNMFAYCNNNPVNSCDCSGMCSCYPGGITDCANYIAGLPCTGAQSNNNATVEISDKGNYVSKKDFENYVQTNFLDYLKVASGDVYYRGAKVVVHNYKRLSSWQFGGTIYLKDDSGQFNETTLNHEYGHYIQERTLGTVKYTAVIMIPSMITYGIDQVFPMSNEDYFSKPWEYSADILGGVTRPYPYNDGASFRGNLYYFYFLVIQ